MEKNEKKCQVHLIDTKESLFYLNHGKLSLSLYGNIKINDGDKEPKHLYITSDDEIKEGDWYCNLGKKADEYGIVQCNTQRLSILATNAPSCRKVIATTNTSLRMYGEPVINGTATFKGLLPQPSESFITKYIESYNKREVIENILVEYYKGHINVFKEHIPTDCKCDYFFETGEYSGLKVNPKDNTITIRKIKDSYTLQEVKELLYKVYWEGWSNGKLEFNEALPFYNKFIEDKL